MNLISGTYTDMDIVKNNYILTELYDTDTLDAQITNAAQEAKRWVNNFLGRQTDFTAAELEEAENECIVSAACLRTACILQQKQQERGSIAEETLRDCKEAEKILAIWMKNHGLTPPDEMKKSGRINPEPLYVYPDVEYVI
ncbi:hypothetical protein DRN97_03025 [Methanosarcinales archaeon]|nr:MAG: hypothetical protein DRN97_03025 [Methanosarcinales archaeon]